jgi:hypothetical protein
MVFYQAGKQLNIARCRHWESLEAEQTKSEAFQAQSFDRLSCQTSSVTRAIWITTEDITPPLYISDDRSIVYLQYTPGRLHNQCRDGECERSVVDRYI